MWSLVSNAMTTAIPNFATSLEAAEERAKAAEDKVKASDMIVGELWQSLQVADTQRQEQGVRAGSNWPSHESKLRALGAA